MTCTDSIDLSVHFENWPYCRLVNDLFYYFKTRNIVEMSRIFLIIKNCRLIEITAEYCQKSLFIHAEHVVHSAWILF